MWKIETGRFSVKSACSMRMAGMDDMAELLEASEILKMSLGKALTLARAFSHYLNLMGIAEAHHRVRRQKNVASLSKSCDDIFNQLLQRGVSPDQLYDTICNQEVEIVLTAHPTQINCGTLQYKHIRLSVREILLYGKQMSLGTINPHQVMKLGQVTKDVSLLSRWMTIDLYIREVDSLKFELSMNRCSDILSKLAQEILEH
ncbi:phosphoenolpyruvate carboxylase 4-like isoform X2 [Rosa chinensis]|nr:phosphoenolpyruvate carboxylase 4-like isoform X2 [Rosa chinensis]